MEYKDGYYALGFTEDSFYDDSYDPYDPYDISEYDDLISEPYIPIMDREITEFSARYIEDKEYLAIHYDCDEDYGLWNSEYVHYEPSNSSQDE